MTPYGYKIVRGKAVFDLDAARQVREIFRLYLSGLSIKEATEQSGFPLSIGTAGNILKREVYAGDDFYPPLITKEMYDRVQEERKRRQEMSGRVKKSKPQEANPVRTKFRIRFPRMPSNAIQPGTATGKAQLFYSLIQASDTGKDTLTSSEQDLIQDYWNAIPEKNTLQENH